MGRWKTNFYTMTLVGLSPFFVFLGYPLLFLGCLLQVQSYLHKHSIPLLRLHKVLLVVGRANQVLFYFIALLLKERPQNLLNWLSPLSVQLGPGQLQR